jgi:PGF-CTERM protein
MESAGMNVATASIDGGSDIVDQDSEDYPEPKDKKGEKPHDGDGASQTAEASVTQYQSVEQMNVNLNSSAQAIATDGSSAEAVQLTYQQNINAQIGSADALNVFLEDAADGEKYEKGHDYEGAVLTETTNANISGNGVEDADRTAFDYDGNNDQLNTADQYSTAEIEQSQDVTQLNLVDSNNAIAVADDNGSASAFQMTMQENQNVQISSADATSVEEGVSDDEEGDDKKDDKDEKAEDKKDEEGDDKMQDEKADDKMQDEKADDEKKDDEETESMPGFGVTIALVAMLAAAMLGLRTELS